MPEPTRGFEVFPKIVRGGTEAAITIGPLPDEAEYDVRLVAAEGIARRGKAADDARMRLRVLDGRLAFRHVFDGEQEHVILVEPTGGTEGAQALDCRVYSVGDDLFSLRPYKGDFHIHSDRSDGREPPAHVAAACRRIGLDFVAVTDHYRYEPSLEAIRAFDGVEMDFRVFPGEEVHPPDNPIHIVNFGGSFSVNKLIDDEQSYRAGVRGIEEKLKDLSPGIDPYLYASAVWCFDRIREAQGLSLFCHPYWFTEHRYDVPEALTTQLLANPPFDALELVSGYSHAAVESNILQVARYHEERAKGKRIPVVGVSDAHGCERGELFGWYYTVVFAPSPDLADVIQSVKELRSVAVEALPGQTPRAHGPFRLTKYAQFLLREVLWRHDELCREEGELMLAHIAGDAEAAGSLAVLRGRTEALYNRLWQAE
jgi:hypothetical protein